MIKSDPESPIVDNLQVPFKRVGDFIRQVTHDVRNSLNALDLQTAYVQEIALDAEVREELKRMRSQIQHAARAMHALSANFRTTPPAQIAYAAGIFVEDLRDRLARQFPEKMGPVEWAVQVGEESVNVDIELIFAVFTEVFENTFQFAEAGGNIAVAVFVRDGHFVLEVRETKKAVPADPATWGVEPFVSTRRGNYGLGLYRARSILEAHCGTLQFSHDPADALLISRVTLPLAS